ncbi:MAG TPA: helix-turn-helix domain-containing protein [Bacilli bacterium]|nr:helix-turn-helix domain-containing protein [Bacilli bacterium]
MNKRKTYDVNLKLTIVNEYAAGGTTYARLAEKYDIPRSNVAKWIQKYKKHYVDPLIQAPQGNEFLNITNALLPREEEQASVTIIINGFELTSNLNTLRRLLKGAKDV